MSGVLTGFVVVASLVAVGWVLGRTGVLGPTGQVVVSRLVFFVGSPALLVQTLAEADVHLLLSTQLLVSASGVAVCVLAWLVLACWRLGLRRDDLVIGSLASSFVNAANIGLPVAAYVLDDVTAVLPALLLQMVVLGPVALGVLDVSRHGAEGGRSLRRLLAPLANPVLVGSALGLLLSATGWTLPTALAQPLGLLAGLAIPGALVAFGMSLHGRSLAGWRRPEVLLASALKGLVQPAATYCVARFAVGLDDAAVFAATVVAALPTAQNVFTFAVRYGVARDLARDTVLVTTVLLVPVLLGLSLLLPR
ncbi:AEC family transporter [Kineococcus sp. T13]|uniref:AEC family transporter n=1 Tax=Kineococcus vitellinus TaxID=2696565 RepID=UPI0014133D48|nr:AEC family transporter [Kineococcus vitellinus]